MSRQAEIDDAGLLRLLWHPERPATPRPGPKSTLTLAAIIATGIAIADDRDGPALSMRLVAERLGCTSMAIYSYVDNKQTLMRLMYDAAHADFEPRADDVDAWATALADVYARHHWLSDVSWSRPVLGPHEQAVLEDLLRRLQPLDLTGTRNGTIASALFALCRNTGRTIADARHAPHASGLSDEEWWAAQSAAMAQVVPDLTERFPLSAGLGIPDEDTPTIGGYLERTARIQLRHAVRLVLAGATKEQ